MRRFEVLARAGLARRGRIATNHGIVETPAFMPVGTVGSVKAVDASDLEAAGAGIMLANTYHLLLRPGPEVLERSGGLHGYAGWKRPILTDSGGFQVMSLAKFREISDQGVRFRSHLDGAEVSLTPEEVVRVQNAIGSDIQMPLDVCPPAGAGEDEVAKATELSLAWAGRTLACAVPEGVLRFGIVQGGMSADLRRASAARTAEFHFDGFAIGGLSVGEPEATMFEMLAATQPNLPEDRPRYLMGVGKPSQILRAVARGVDLFDCVLPTRVARHGTLWTSLGLLRIDNAAHAEDHAPPDAACRCLLCARYGRAYLRHLYRAKDPLYLRLASIHNLTYLLGYLARIREAIERGTFPVLRGDQAPDSSDLAAGPLAPPEGL